MPESGGAAESNAVWTAACAPCAWSVSVVHHAVSSYMSQSSTALVSQASTAGHHTTQLCLKRAVPGMQQDLAGIAGDVMAALDSLRPAFEWPADGAANAVGSEFEDMGSPEHPAHTPAGGASASAPAPGQI